MQPICKTLAFNHCADIHVSPDGRFVYGSNRGHESIAIFEVDQNDGTLTPVDYVDIDGSIPRSFALTPDGNFLLVACQDTHTVNTFKIDKKTGSLTNTGYKIHVPSPVSVCVAP